MSSTHDTAACGENAGGAEISEQRRLVASERMERANTAIGLPPPKPEAVKPALRKDIGRVKAKLKAQNLTVAQGAKPQPLSSNSGVQVSLRQCNPPYCPVMVDPSLSC